MIGYLKGKVINAYENAVLLEVNGVGYELICTRSAAARLVADGYGEVYTYLAVNDQGINFYGFSGADEKAMFIKLISVSGVGPKMGVTILSDISLSDLATAIATNDVKTLSSVKGCGKKTAERIILELREKITAVSKEEKTVTPDDGADIDKQYEDAVIALMSLGFTKGESVKAVKAAISGGASGLRGVISAAIGIAGSRV